MLRLTLREGKPRTVTTPSGEVFSIALDMVTRTKAHVSINWGPPFNPADATCDEPCGPALETIDEHSSDS